MIYLCQTCGHRINQRTCDGSVYQPNEPLRKRDIKAEDVGKHLLYNHKPFCSEKCIEEAKKNHTILLKDVTPANELERCKYNPDRPNGLANWKTERKIRRKNRFQSK